MNPIKPMPPINPINKLFKERGTRKLLSLYFCAGHPHLEDTGQVILSLQAKGVDMLEVGIPFSDPMADGPVIQDCATKALRNGMTLSHLFGQLEAIKGQVTIPLLLMGYMNPIYKMGYEAFFSRCKEVGVSGVIMPDLPFKDYLEEVKPIAEAHGIVVVMLITPETSDERIRFIDEHTDGFIYMVSSAAVTGAQREFDERKQAYFSHVNEMHLRHPRMIGFGISNKQTWESAKRNAAGCIIGSKFCTLLEKHEGDASSAFDELMACLQSL